MSQINLQKIAEQVPAFFTNIGVYQTIYFQGKKIVKGHRDNIIDRMNLIRKEDIKDKVIVDIGSNIGASSIWAVDNGAKKAIGFEVVPERVEASNKIAQALNLNCEFRLEGFNKEHPKLGDVAFCFAVHDDIGNDDILVKNLKKFDVIYFETHLKGSFKNWDMPKKVREAFKVELLGTITGEDFERDFYRLCQK
jgi:hypothetical protein